jgi:hypothetical protein
LIDQRESQWSKRSTDALELRIHLGVTGHKLINGRYSVLTKSYCRCRMPDVMRPTPTLTLKADTNGSSHSPHLTPEI